MKKKIIEESKMKEKQKLEKMFEKANKDFIKKNIMLLETQVSERTLCGALMIEIYKVLKNTEFSKYYVDVEYNRNIGGKVKTIRKTVQGSDMQIITINCDLIVHSRGENVSKDNLIALEMKKSTGKKVDKEKDKARLECLTKPPGEDIWSYDGKVFPEHVCGYKLGIYYEINYKKRNILIEYYSDGYVYNKYVINF